MIAVATARLGSLIAQRLAEDYPDLIRKVRIIPNSYDLVIFGIGIGVCAYPVRAVTKDAILQAASLEAIRDELMRDFEQARRASYDRIGLYEAWFGTDGPAIPFGLTDLHDH